MSKGRCTKFFPGKLRLMLDEVEGLGLSPGSSWVSEGHAFAIHDPDVFMRDIAPTFFDKQTHLRSFHRQLNIWGFTRLETASGGRGVWFHKHFSRDEPELMKHIKRVSVKNPKQRSVSALPKNKLPGYNDYKLPVSISQCQAEPPKVATNRLPVHTHISAATAANPTQLPVINEVHVPSCPSVAQLSSLIGHMPTVVPTSRFIFMHDNAALPVPVGSDHLLFSDQTRRCLSSLLTGYQPSAVSLMNHLPGLSAVSLNTPRANNLNEVAQQSFLYAASAPPPLLGGGSNNLNAVLLAMIPGMRTQGSHFHS